MLYPQGGKSRAQGFHPLSSFFLSHIFFLFAEKGRRLPALFPKNTTPPYPTMKATQQTKTQIERAIRKIADKFPASAEPVMTDIMLQVKPDSGELLAFNDDMEELTRIVVDQWLQPTEENLYDVAAQVIKQCLTRMRSEIDKMSILHPFTFVLIDEDKETLADLYIVDEDTIMLDTELLKGLDAELNDFLHQLLEE